MRWFKHFTNSRIDPFIRDLVNEFGKPGYAIWWMLLEIIAEQMNEKTGPTCTMTERSWCQDLAITKRTLNLHLTFMQSLGKIEYSLSGNQLTVTCPKLLEIKDEHLTKTLRNSGVTPDSLRQDKDIETNKKENGFNFTELKLLSSKLEEIRDGWIEHVKPNGVSGMLNEIGEWLTSNPDREKPLVGSLLKYIEICKGKEKDSGHDAKFNLSLKTYIYDGEWENWIPKDKASKPQGKSDYDKRCEVEAEEALRRTEKRMEDDRVKKLEVETKEQIDAEKAAEATRMKIKAFADTHGIERDKDEQEGSQEV